MLKEILEEESFPLPSQKPNHPMHWYLKDLNQYFDFTGRARRSEYWYFLLFNFIVSLIALAPYGF